MSERGTAAPPPLLPDVYLAKRSSISGTVELLSIIPKGIGLKILGLTTLETRRLRTDLIEVFKILKGYENIDKKVFFICHSPAFVVIH